MEHPQAQAQAQAQAAQSLSRRDASASGSSNPLRRSLHVLSDLMPFSSTALASLPKDLRVREREVRADRIPTNADVREYGATGVTLPPNVRVPKKLATPIKVEGKVWLASERTWISYLNISLLLGTLSLALLNAAKDDITRRFAITYAMVSVGILVYGYVVYQQRITMIRRRDPGHYDQIVGPLVISGALFLAVLTNFIVRLRAL